MSIPAGTVLLVATGGVLIYAGFTNNNPLTALKEVASGKPSTVRNTPGVDSADYSSTSGVTGGGIADISFADASGQGLAALPKAAEQYAGDRYSKPKRNVKGYSDCSSFVGKALKLIGVKPPAGSTTASYLASKQWKRVTAGNVQAGDLAIALNHVVICYGNGYAIGQQNSRSNVQRGKVDDLMIGNKPYIFLRYTADTAAGKSDAGSVMA